MLRKRTLKYILSFWVVFLQMNFLYSQNILNKQEQIDACFKALRNASSSEFNKNLNAIESYPFYEPFIYQDIIRTGKIINAALCTEYCSSVKLSLLKTIYLLFTNEDSSFIYNLVDGENNIIYDLRKYNCSGMRKEIGTSDTINQAAIIELIKSYYEWYAVVKKGGYIATLEQKIYPTSFSKYKWVKEIGLFQGVKTTDEILKAASQIMNDSNYLTYFIKTRRLNRFYSNTNEKDIISELALLAIINKQQPFTTNILRFKLISLNISNKEKAVSNFLQEILKNESKYFDYLQFMDLMKKNELLVVLKN